MPLCRILVLLLWCIEIINIVGASQENLVTNFSVDFQNQDEQL